MVSPSSLDRAQAFRYMGLHGKPDAHMTALADECEAGLLRVIHPRYIHRFFRLDFRADGILCEGSTLLLTGEDIRRHLEGCTRAVLFCATLSASADAEIRRMQQTDITAGVMTDAMASALIEQVCDLAEQEILAEVPALHPTWRFSPGYGDLPLAIQGTFLTAIDAARRVGVCVSESGILTPRKSVTAIIGLSETPVQRQRKGCAICSLSRTCPYRAKGEHCK